MEMDSVVFLEELLTIPSPSGEEDAVAKYLGEQMTTLGFRPLAWPAANPGREPIAAMPPPIAFRRRTRWR